MPSPDLAAAKRTDSDRKRRAVQDAVRAMREEGVPINFRAVARRAGVSHWLVYQEPLRALIEAARDQVEALTPKEDGQVQALAAQVRVLTETNRTLERRLTEALAPVVVGNDDMAALRARGVALRAERDQLAREVEALSQELEGTRTALRQMMLKVN